MSLATKLHRPRRASPRAIRRATAAAPVRLVVLFLVAWSIAATTVPDSRSIPVSTGVDRADAVVPSATGPTASAVPSSGAAPLTVNFSGSEPATSGSIIYTWIFGDGNSTTAATTDHTYLEPGTYSAELSVSDGSVVLVSRQFSIQVLPEPLDAALTVERASGSPNTTLALALNVTGGVPPYAVTWTFGDGTQAATNGLSITHRYPSSGSYRVSARIDDGDGSAVNASDVVLVVGAPSAGPACGGAAFACGAGSSLVPLVVTTAILVGLGAALAIWQLSRSGASRMRSGAPPRPAGSRTGPTVRPPKSAAPAGPVRAVAPAPPTSATSSPRDPPLLEARSSRPIAESILVHLYAQGVPDPTRAVPEAFTQAGVAAALGRPQGAFAKALLRLEEAGLLASEVQHVCGRRRRAKTYRLTPRGESAARRLRESGLPLRRPR